MPCILHGDETIPAQQTSHTVRPASGPLLAPSQAFNDLDLFGTQAGAPSAAAKEHVVIMGQDEFHDALESAAESASIASTSEQQHLSGSAVCCTSSVLTAALQCRGACCQTCNSFCDSSHLTCVASIPGWPGISHVV